MQAMDRAQQQLRQKVNSVNYVYNMLCFVVYRGPHNYTGTTVEIL